MSEPARSTSSSKQTHINRDNNGSVSSDDNMQRERAEEMLQRSESLLEPISHSVEETTADTRSEKVLHASYVVFSPQMSAEEVVEAADKDRQVERTNSSRLAFILAFLSICMSSFLSALDLTSVSTALPTIVANLPLNSVSHHSHSSTFAAQNVTSSTSVGNSICSALINSSAQQGGNFVWVGTAYTLAGTAIMPWMGSLAQIWGRKNLFIISIVLFAAGSAICGTASSLNMLIGGRVIQGLGDGGIISLSEILIADLVPLAERGTYEGLLGCVWALASAIGPPIGGALSSHGKWRWLFYINLPLCLLSIIIISFFLVNRAPEATFRSKIAQMDWTGNFIIISSLICITLALCWGGTEFAWISAPVLVTIILGVLLFVSFFLYEWRFARYPSMPSTLIKSHTAKSAYLSTFLHGVVSMAVIYVLPSYFRACLRASPIRAGVMILPLALTIAPFAIVGAVIIEETERYIAINYVGWTFSLVGVALLTLLQSHPHVWLWVIVQIPLGIGLGFLYVAPQFPLLAAVSPQLAAPALATYTFVSSLGQTLGIAIGDAGLQSTVRPILASICQDPHGISSTLGAVQGIHQLPHAIRVRVVDAYVRGFRVVWISMIPFAAAGLLTCLALRTIKLHTDIDQDYFALADRHRREPKAAPDPDRSPETA